jgi:hypothetical protein
MPVSLVEDSSLLAVNVGASSTRAVLFDVVEGEYRFIASGQAASTAEAPFGDVALGVRAALSNLQTVTGRTFLDAEKELITPSQADGSGIDAFTVTISAGPALRAVVVGLLADVSLESAQKLAETTYLRIIETFSINDHRKPDEQLDAVIRAKPDVIIFAGGTDGGATRSIQKILDAVGLACFLTPEEKRPAVLFAGNQKMVNEIKSSLGTLASTLSISPNIRPSLNTEDLEPASRELAQIYLNILKKRITGVSELETWSGGHILPTAYAEERIIRFLSQLQSSHRNILNVDIGSTAAIIAAGFGERSTLNVLPQFGLGENLASLLQYTDLTSIMRWLPMDISPGDVRDYLYQRALSPVTIPVTKEDMAITQSVSRQALHLAIQHAKDGFPSAARYAKSDLLPFFEPILASGGAISDAPSPGQSLLLLLDAIQPIGVTSVIVDQNNLLPMLGVAAEINPLLPVQVLESGAFMSMGTVVSVISSASYGTPVLRAQATYANGSHSRIEVNLGGLEILPLGMGQTARLTLQPMKHADIGNGPGRNATIQVVGGVMGIVIDARGRPLTLPEDAVLRRELINKWLWSVGG